MQDAINRVRRWPASTNILVLTIYALLVVVMTWPVAGRLGSAFPASDGDAWVHLWTFNWVKEALQSGQNPFFTDLLFYPDGVSLAYHNIAWLQIAAWLPFQALVGLEAAYSLIFLAVFVINGFAAYLLAREISGSDTAAFIGGLIVAFWPYILSHHNHPNLILIAWIPLALLHLKRFFERRQLWQAFFAALFIALIGLTRWQLLIIGGFLIGLYVMTKLLVDTQARTVRMLAGLAGIGLLSAVMMAPLLAPVLSAQLSREDPEALFVDEEVAQTDLLAYIVPSRYHPLWGDAAFQLAENLGVDRVFVPFIGFAVLLLAIVGSITNWPRSGFWLASATLYIVLALGSDLHVNGRIINLPMPYRLIEDLFFIKIIRHPDRLNVVLAIPVAILATMGVTSLLQRIRGKRRSLALAAFVAVLIMAEYIVSYPTFPASIPDWYTALAEETGQFGILGIPMTPRASPDKAYMYYQTRHGKPLVEGHVSRPPDNAFDFIDQVPLLHNMRPADITTPDPGLINVSEQMRQLAAANIRYLILHKAFLSTGEIDLWRSWLVQDPVHEDEALVVYRTDPQLGRDFFQSQEITAGSGGKPGIGLVRTTVTPTQTIQGGTIQVAVVWDSGSEIDDDLTFCLNVVGDQGEKAQSSCRLLAPEWPTSRWQADEIVAGDYVIEFSPYLPGGDYAITISLMDPAGVVVGESAPIGNLALTAQPRSFSSPEPAIQSSAIWDEKISLLGYDLSYPDSETLAVTLYWRAERRMDESYTTFLHLIDPGSGQIVSQADVIPRGWSYPTNWWEAGEVVQDTVRLLLADAPPGDYALLVGWYQLETGKRLSIAPGAGQVITDNALLLTVLGHEGQDKPDG
jgi:hypothetical protein